MSEKQKKKRSVGRIVLNTVLSIVLALVVLLVAVLFINKARSVPTFIFGKSIAWVITPSMEDTIPAQSFILLEKATADDVSVGDVITFRSSNPSLKGGFNTHRVVAIDESRSVFTTKGDNNNVDDGEYSAKADEIVGKYVRNLPVLSALMRFFTRPAGFILVILFLVALTVVMFIPDVKRGLKKEDAGDELKKEQEKKRLLEEELARLKREGADVGGAGGAASAGSAASARNANGAGNAENAESAASAGDANGAGGAQGAQDGRNDG